MLKVKIGRTFSKELDDAQEHPTLRAFLSDRTHLRNICIMVIQWSVGSFNYYLISYYMKYINGIIFVNNIFSSLSECIAYVLSAFIAAR